jgi:spore germination protein
MTSVSNKQCKHLHKAGLLTKQALSLRIDIFLCRDRARPVREPYNLFGVGQLMLSLLILSLFTIAPINAQDTDEPAATDTPAWCVSVWYPSSEFPGGMESIINPANPIDEINAFWYTPAPDGSLIVLPTAEKQYEIDAWREAGLLIIPSIFGSVPDVITPRLRDIHVQAIVDTVLRMDYDGIDIDYEGFPSNTRDNFSDFVEALRVALHAEDKILSVTVHAKVNEGVYEGALAQDWYRIMKASDMFKIMSYDYTNRNEPPGPIAPLNWVLEVLTYAEHVADTIGDDLSKVYLGLHFYGYSWQRGTPPATTVAYAGIQHYLDNFNLAINRDPEDMEAFIDFKITGLPRQVVYFADPAGLQFKLDHIREQFAGIGGVAIWGIGGEHPEIWDTLRTFTEGCV